MSGRFLILGAALLLPACLPAKADPTPALPFFSKPFPAGYAYRRPRCLVRREVITPQGVDYEVVDACRPVLRSRD